MAKKVLQIDIAYDLQIWGINSNMEDYRLCWHLNHYLGWQLKRIADIEYQSVPAKNFQHFNAYKYKNEIDFYTLELIQNKNVGNILIPELKNIDFLFLLSGEDDYFDFKEFIDLLERIPGVQSVMQIDIKALKSKHNLLIRHFNEPF